MVFSILSYCDTEFKKTQLRDLISTLKQKYPDDEVLVYSHYANVEPVYYQMADYFIFDKSNPKSPKRFTDWVYIVNQNKTFNRTSVDWGFAVLQMIKRTLIFLKSIGVEETMFLNYDSSIPDIKNWNLDTQISALQDYHIGMFNYWGDENGFSLTQFFIRPQKLYQQFLDLINYDYYISQPHTLTPEQVWKNIVVSTIGENLLVVDFKVSLMISLVSRALPDNSSLRKYFDTVLPTRDSQTNKKCLAIWNATCNLESVEISINDGESQIFYNEIDVENRHHSFFCHLEVDDIHKIKLLSVNDEPTEEFIIENLNDDYWLNNNHTTH